MSERFPDIDWWCDRCKAYLNSQIGFDDHRYTWKCTECGHKNSISRDNIYKSHEDYWHQNNESTGGKLMGIMDLLKQLADGVYDGERTDSEMNGVSSGFYIDKGTPVKYREGKSTKFFDGKENIRTPGKRTEERFVTDEEKTTFFQSYGFIRDMFGDHPEVLDYSRQYYEDKKKNK